MKREVWVEVDSMELPYLFICTDRFGKTMYLQKQPIHESCWIPVSERMPTKTGHYHVFRLEREDWCYCELVSMDFKTPISRFTSKGVTHWLEAPPLPPAEEEFCLGSLQVGDLIRNKGSGASYTVKAVDNNGAIAVRYIEVTNPTEWEKI